MPKREKRAVSGSQTRKQRPSADSAIDRALEHGLLAFLTHVELCVMSTVEKTALTAGRKEQASRDQRSSEHLGRICGDLDLHMYSEFEDELEQQRAMPCMQPFLDPRLDQQHWDAMPSHAQLLALQAFVARVQLKISVELHSEGLLQECIEYFEGMLQNNGVTDHAEVNPLTPDLMGRVLGRFYVCSLERTGTVDLDLSELLQGMPAASIWDTAPRDTIFDILLDALGYDDDRRNMQHFPGPWIYTGRAGSMGKYRRTLKTEPDFTLTPWAERPPLSERQRASRDRWNTRWPRKFLFSWPHGSGVTDSDTESGNSSSSDSDSD